MRSEYSVNQPLSLETENVTIDFSSRDNLCPNTNNDPVDTVSYNQTKAVFLSVLYKGGGPLNLYLIKTCSILFRKK